MSIEQMDAEVIKKVASVVRLVRPAGELTWMQVDSDCPRSSHHPGQGGGAGTGLVDDHGALA